MNGVSRWIARSAVARPVALVGVTFALLIVFPALRVITDNAGWMLFSIVPIVLLAMMYGVRGGLAAAAASSGAYLAFAIAGDGAGTTENTGAPLAYFVIGFVTGVYAHGALGDFDVRAMARRSELRDGIRKGQIVMHYQPVVEARTGAVIGLEGLARWEHPKRGLVSPAGFVPLAEGNERTIWELTLDVAELALSDVARLWDNEWPLVVAINLSATNLHRDELALELSDRMRAHHCPPGRLMVELTETAVASNGANAAASLGRLREKGMAVALDDFGTGQSSLTRLADLPLDVVKLDLKEFWDTTPSARTRAGLVRGVVELSHSLGLTVIAEQVSDDERQRLTQASGVDLVQGFRICHPLPADELMGWLQDTSVQIGPSEEGREALPWLPQGVG